MNSNTAKAAELLKSGEFTCVLCDGDISYKSAQRGVLPLVMMLDSGKSLNGFCAADKVVGKAAAFLYVLLGVSEVYAPVMSKTAISVFERHGINFYYDTITDVIINRKKDGICPMEMAVTDISAPREAITAIRAALAGLMQKERTN